MNRHMFDTRAARMLRCWVRSVCLCAALAGAALLVQAQPEGGPHAPDRVEEDGQHEAAAASEGEGHTGHVNGWHFFLVQSLGFAFLLAVAYRFAWPAIRGGLDGRAHRIRDAFEKSEGDEREAERLLTEYRDRLSGFAVEARRRRDATLREGEALRAQIESDARDQARSAVEKARREVEFEEARAQAEVREAVIERAFAEAERMLRRRGDDRFQGALVDRAIRELEGLPILKF